MAFFAVLGLKTSQAGQLDELRNDVRAESSSSSSECDDKPSSGSSSSWSSCDDDADSLWGKFLFNVITAPWGLPFMLSGDDLGRAAFFPDAPYDNGVGYLAIEPVVPEQYHCWGGHFRAEYADDFDDLSRIGGRLIVEHTLRVGFDAEWNYWQENLGGGGHDWLHTGDANLVYRFAQNEHIAMRSGVGVCWLDDQQETNYGFNFTYGLDFFPCKPWILSADIDWGTLGGRSLFHGRATAGVIVGHAEVYVGYDYYDVGDVALNGLVAGVGFWF